MTRIHFAADHGGYELGRSLAARAEAAGFEVVGHGADELDPGDDYPIFAVRVGQATIADQDAGIDAFAVLVVGEALCGQLESVPVLADPGGDAHEQLHPAADPVGLGVVDGLVRGRGLCLRTHPWHRSATAGCGAVDGEDDQPGEGGSAPLRSPSPVTTEAK